jgi:hypothetical protein
MRGTPGYPKGEAFQVVPSGLLLRPAIPSAEIFGVSNTYGPMANFKVSLRELPDHGNFRVTVRAARYDDALLLESGAPVQPKNDPGSVSLSNLATSPDATLIVAEAGVYQVDIDRGAGDFKGVLSLEIGGRNFAGQLDESTAPPAAGNGDANAADDLRPVERLAGPVALDDEQRHLLDPLEGREPRTTGKALATATYGRAVVGGAGVDHLVVVGGARRAAHGGAR